jgi:ureidoglycolate dehydrogenase (NAD+)
LFPYNNIIKSKSFQTNKKKNTDKKLNLREKGKAMKNYSVNPASLRNFTEQVFSGAGVPGKDAAEIAELLVHADLRGVHSHGAIRIPSYLEKIQKGGASLDSSYPIVKETPVSAVIDAQGGLGAVAGTKAVDLARSKAEKSGMAIVAVRNSNHFGMAGHWSLKLAGDNMIGFACSTTDLTMGAPGSKVPFMGNNPFSFAVKAGNKYPEFCVDMATSTVAMGKCKDLAKRGKPISHGWMLDKDGNDTTDISKCSMMTTMAGHKGFGIALIVELFATMLSGGVLSPDINNQDLPEIPELSSQAFGCIKIDRFRDLKDFENSMETYIDRLHELPMREGAGRAKYPGEIEYENKKRNLKEGIVLPETLVSELKTIGEKMGIETSFLSAAETDRA